MQPKVLALGDVIGELAQMLRRLLREGIDLKVEHGADLWPVHADEAQLSNAIINLVVNARDAMPRRRHGHHPHRQRDGHAAPSALGTAIMPAGDYVRIEVADTGIGMSKENLEQDLRSLLHHQAGGPGHRPGPRHRLWHRQADRRLHHRGQRSRQRHHASRSICRAIASTRARRRSPKPSAAAPRDVTGQDTILLVEDEEAVRSFAARALRMRGYNVLEASGGEEALEIVKTGKAPDPSSDHRCGDAQHGRADPGARMSSA